MDDPVNRLLIILAEFNIEPGRYTFKTVTEGLINQSYRVENQHGKPEYFLQQIDQQVFQNIEGLMGNVEVVIDHLSQPEVDIEHLELIPLQKGDSFLLNEEGSYWRLYRFISGKTYFKAKNELIASEAGRAFGEFLGALSNIDTANLIDTIPQFHDVNLRYEQFTEALMQASSNRIISSQEEVSFIEKEIGLMKGYYSELEASIPKRVTHNDTKLSNLLFDDHETAKLVVDYDTLMPGYIPLDYGDSVRTICSTTEEDSRDLESTEYRLDLIEAFTNQFVLKLRGKITNEELQLLPLANCYMPFIMGLRMLTDYLNNDVYFRINYPEHNLDRARNQFHVYMSGQSLQVEINNIVNNLT